VDKKVNYPLENLNLDEYIVDQEAKDKGDYILAGVICHDGTLSFGHYWMLGRNLNDGKW
jgi:ubiquitin C-terminal hydrolase